LPLEIGNKSISPGYWAIYCDFSITGDQNRVREATRAAPTELASVERVILHYQEGSSAGAAPTELASVERVILHYQEGSSAGAAPTELASVERVILHYRGNRAPDPPPWRQAR